LKEAITLECYWRVSNGQSGESLLTRLALAWQFQDVRLLSWEADLCSCNNQVDPSISRDCWGIVIDWLIGTATNQEPTLLPVPVPRIVRHCITSSSFHFLNGVVFPLATVFDSNSDMPL